MGTFTTLNAICDFFIANASSILTYLDLNSITMNSAAKAVELFDEKVNRYEYNPKNFLDSIESEMEICASALIRYIESRFAIYDLLENDLVKGRGYANLVSIAADYYVHGESIKHNIELNAIQQKVDAQRIASSKVTGLGFGIVSNSLVAHLIYNAQSEAAIKKQTDEAKEYLSSREAEISWRARDQWHSSQMQYFHSNLGPKMREAIPYAYTDMLARCVAFLGKRNYINIKLIEGFDFERSQAILDKVYSISSSVHKIIEDAFRWCPYNINVYIKAKQCGLFSDKMQTLAKTLQLNITPGTGKLNVGIERLAAVREKILPVQNRLAVDNAYVAGVNVDGTIAVWGYKDHRCEISSWRDIKAISVGRNHTIGLKRDNTVVSTKFSKRTDNDTDYGQCEVSEWKDIIAVSAGWDHTVGLKSDGLVVAIGNNEDGQCEVSDWSDIVAVSAGSSYTIGLKADGTVVAVGNNCSDQCEVSDWKDIVAISAGLLKGMFHDKKLTFTYSDIPTNLSTAWVDKIMPVFQSIMVAHDKNTGISEILKKISTDDKLLPEYSIECFHAEIQVDYDPTGDDIQLFADYLMDLDESKHSFYFIYSYEPSIASFEKHLVECYDKLSSRFLDISNPDCKEKETKLYFIKEELLKLYCHALLEKCYFCNSSYENTNSIEITAFKNLFNFRDIPAIRELDDNESDTSKGISKKIISLLKGNENWEEVTKKLPDLLMEKIDSSGAKNEIKNSSIKSLNETVQDISRTSGGHIGTLQLEMDVNVNDVEDFIQKITRAKYDIDGLLLNEQSQGLGFSNLIYLNMMLEEFYKSVDESKVNVFFIEEPESHMHPQMQNVFIRFLTQYYTEKKLQGLITTHSNEIARSVGLNSLRVIRQTEKSKSELFNLSKFRKSIENKKVKNVDEESEFLLQNFFDWFFEIGYSELIFADKVVLYEGDTERLYIRKLLGMTEFASLRDNYIAFIQVESFAPV